MKNYKILILFIMAFMIWLHCENQADKVVGSIDHDIGTLNTLMPELLADGIATTHIIAIVYNKDGTPTQGMKVVFKTSHGSIQKSAYSDIDGEADVILTSAASDSDLTAEVTATVVDTTFEALKNTGTPPCYLAVQVPGHDTVPQARQLAKPARPLDNTATIYIKFLGVTLSAEIDDTILPADGISQTKVRVKLRETTSQKAIENAQIRFGLKYGIVSASTTTEARGIAETMVRAADKAGQDTLCALYGNRLTKCLAISYVDPKLELITTARRIPADGASRAPIIATLLSHTKNTPIVGAVIKFSATNGIIKESELTNDNGQAIVDLVSARAPDSLVVVQAQFRSLTDTVKIAFVSTSARSIVLEADSQPLIRDGVAGKQMLLRVKDDLGQPVANTRISLQANLGTVPAEVITNANGSAIFDYVADAGTTDAVATVTATFGAIRAIQTVQLLGISLKISATPDSIAADGQSKATIRLEAKLTTSNLAIAGHLIYFAVDHGTIQENSSTDDQGVALADFTADVSPGIVTVTARCGKLSKSVSVYLFGNIPTSLLIEANPQFIWVKETGNLEQTIISATVIGITGQPVGDNLGVKFRIIKGPDGGEGIEPSVDAQKKESSVIRTVNGRAEAMIRAGTRSGPVQISAELVTVPKVAARTTNLIIRSGPPYIWIDPANVNHVISHSTLVVEPGKHNVGFGNPVQDIKVTAIFGDKYNNPVEAGTAVYFTTTGGIITTDAVTNEKGQAQVILQNVYPFPELKTSDTKQLTACCIPNPNNELVPLKVLSMVHDFEKGKIINTLGNTAENDGIAVLLAYSWGQDQENKQPKKVWTTSVVVYSTDYYVFTAEPDKTEIKVNEAATISIWLYDRQGNPMAAGSRLTASTTAGELSDTSLMPEAADYGWGSTFFQVTLRNNLDPDKDKSKVADVKIQLDSPNGNGRRTVPILLKVGE